MVLVNVYFGDGHSCKKFGRLMALFPLLIFLWFNLTKGIVNIKINSMFFSFDEGQERRIGVFDWINWLYRMVIFRDKKSIFLLLSLEIPHSPSLKKAGF